MLRYIANRLLIALVAIFVLVTLTFFLLRLIPGDPLAAPRLTQEVKERLREHYGLDKPLIEQYGKETMVKTSEGIVRIDDSVKLPMATG